MFNGIVQTKGQVLDIADQPFGRRLVVGHPRQGLGEDRIREGDSICVSGVCLTAVHVDTQHFAFDVITETLSKTTLGRLSVGDPVNLETSLTAATPISGHFVQGHVEGVGTVLDVQSGADHRLFIETPGELHHYLIPKGSVALDGVSMTIAKVGSQRFEVAAIPTTLAMTTLGDAEPGTKLNLETDVLCRTVVETVRRMANGSSGGITLKMLRSAGFAT